MSDELPTKEMFEQAYREKAPWDIGRPQPVVVRSAASFTGAILDVGCGTGENSLFFAERGHVVVGIDYLERPIAEARRKAQRRGLSATFRVHDALELERLAERFDSVLDCGLFHGLSDEERPRYLAGLRHVLREGGRLVLMCFSEHEPPGQGPRRISQAELYAVFQSGWYVESIHSTHFEVRTDMDLGFTAGGPKAWLATIRREPAP